MIHKYAHDDRCTCGGLVVYHEDTDPPGNGCEIEGRPWAADVRKLDPQEQSGFGRLDCSGGPVIK